MSLTDTDWSDEWRRLQEQRGRPDDPARWDARAQEYARRTGAASAYATTFIEYLGIRAGESVLDVGSGSGALALPLARLGHEVCALDFSQQMLAQLERQADQEGLRGIRTIRASWEDDWQAAGVPVADVAIASRSISVRDLGAALRRLDSYARRRACLTVIAGAMYPGAWLAHEAVGREVRESHGFIYCLTILYQMGIRPEVRYIRHGRQRTFAGRDEALRSFRAMIAPQDEREEQLLERYVQQHLVRSTGEDGEVVWRQDKEPAMTWAFIAWDKSP